VARIDLTGNTVHYYLSDHLRSTSMVISSSGGIEQDSDYSPFGTEYTTTSGPNHYKFTSKERDTESGLDYFGARYYSNPLGRWLTPDWSATPVPIPYANLSDPQSLNQYGYVRNNPSKALDSDGHCEVDGEKHGSVWCFFHAIGFTETKAEEQARIRLEWHRLHRDEDWAIKYHNETGWWPDEVMAAGILAYASVYSGTPEAPSEGAPAADSSEGAPAQLQPYEEEGGHHIPAKSAFRGAAGYDLNKALAIPNAELQRLGLSHTNITTAQMELYRSFAQTGSKLTWQAVENIETQALVRAGMNQNMARQTVQTAIRELQKAGVAGPTRIPWGGK